MNYPSSLNTDLAGDETSPPRPASPRPPEPLTDIARMRREVEYIAAIHADGHGAWTPKEWRSFVRACDMLNWSWLLAALDAELRIIE